MFLLTRYFANFEGLKLKRIKYNSRAFLMKNEVHILLVKCVPTILPQKVAGLLKTHSFNIVMKNLLYQP